MRYRQRSAAKEVLWQGLERIGPEHREILVQKELEGHTHGEIATRSGDPEGNRGESAVPCCERALKEALEELGSGNDG